MQAFCCPSYGQPNDQRVGRPGFCTVARRARVLTRVTDHLRVLAVGKQHACQDRLCLSVLSGTAAALEFTMSCLQNSTGATNYMCHMHIHTTEVTAK